MPLELPVPPPEVSSAVRGKLQQYRGPETPNPVALGGSDPGELTLSSPHETYVLGLEDLLSSSLTEAARATGWRYLLYDAEGAVATAETVGTSEGEHRFALFNRGPFVASTVEALRVAAELPQVAEQDMHVRVLTIPALNMVALWLHGQRDDVWVPLTPAPAGIEAGRAYAEAELLNALREPARRLSEIGPADELGS